MFLRYLSLDSYALISAAPRSSVESVLDMCCGSGVQGLVALQHYAKKARGRWRSTSRVSPQSPKIHNTWPGKKNLESALRPLGA